MRLSEPGGARVRAAVFLLAYGAACWFFIKVRDGSILVSILAIFAIVGMARELHRAGREWLKTDRAFQGWWLGLLFVPGFVFVLLWYIGFGDGWGFFGLALTYIAGGLLVDRLREHSSYPQKWGPRIVASCAFLAILGLLLMAFVGAIWTVGLVLIGLLIAPVGLSLLSEARLDALEKGKPPKPWQLAIGGAIAFLGGLVLMALLGVPGQFIVIFGMVVFVLMLAIAARSNADVLIVVAMAAVIWTLTSRSAPVTESLRPTDGEHVIMALGDSYISGEGADDYYEGTNVAGTNTCRRAPTAYPALLMLEDHPAIPRDLAFLACSGATATGVHEQLRTADRLRDRENLDVEFVLLSVGGNDALFGSVGRTCLMPGDCSELSEAWMNNLQHVGTTLTRLYEDVRETFPDTPVLVVPYPIPVSDQSCDYSAFTDAEHQFLNDFATELNAVARRSAADAGFYVVDRMPDSLKDHRLCDGPAGEVGVNFFAANSVGGTLEQTISPINWFHNSLHPNARGHELMRGSLLEWLDEQDDLVAVAPSSAADDDPSATPESATGECQGSAGAELESCAQTWRIQQIGSFLLTKGLVPLLVAAGAWLLVLPIIRTWRRIVPDTSGDRGTIDSDESERSQVARHGS